MPRRRRIVAATLALAGLATAGVGAAVVSADRRHVDASAPTLPAQPRRAVAAQPAAPAAEQVSVAPLKRLVAPDALVTMRHPAHRRLLARLRRHHGIRAVTALDRGTVRLRGHRLIAIGVDPGAVRGFTPSLTARSDRLWQSVARGELTVAYGASRPLRHRLGTTLPVTGRHAARVPLRIGAFASLGLGQAQAVVDRTVARRLHLKPAHQVVVSAPHLSTDALAAVLHRVLGGHAGVHSTRPDTTKVPVSAYASATIPASYLSLYQAAAGSCPGLPWTVLAGIGAVETGHGADAHRSTKGALGPMQFLPSTFREYGVDGDGDGKADINDPADAIYSAARYLCLWGGGRGGQALYDAVFAYNHADWYVRRVFAAANSYA